MYHPLPEEQLIEIREDEIYQIVRLFLHLVVMVIGGAFIYAKIHIFLIEKNVWLRLF